MTMAVDLDVLNIDSGYNTSKINTNQQAVKTSLSDALSRSGVSPNQMETSFDMNDNDIQNVNRIDVQSLYINGVNILDLING